MNVGGVLHPAGRTTGAGLFARYTPDAYVEESVRRWRAFVSAVEVEVVVYLDRVDQTGGLQAIAEQRGAEWLAYATELITDCPFGRRRGLRGIDGVLEIIGEYTLVVDELLGTSHFPRLILVDCAGRWDDCHRRILDFLEVGWPWPS